MHRKIKISPATADTLHEYALALGYHDVAIPPSAQWERYRIESPQSREAGENSFIIFYNNGRGTVTVYGAGAHILYDDFMEGV